MSESDVSPTVIVTPEQVRALCFSGCHYFVKTLASKKGYCKKQPINDEFCLQDLHMVFSGITGCVPWYERYIREYVDEAFIKKMSSFLSSGSIDDNYSMLSRKNNNE